MARALLVTQPGMVWFIARVGLGCRFRIVEEVRIAVSDGDGLASGPRMKSNGLRCCRADPFNTTTETSCFECGTEGVAIDSSTVTREEMQPVTMTTTMSIDRTSTSRPARQHSPRSGPGFQLAKPHHRCLPILTA